ncbi:uncharacterized protein LOC127251379 [Andrographis paniculata]|uniref:uncharacterized protein LOC127251379 n=1 Tax=Andrographis paniculata TaxID=175694 RepID=UPI0021E8B7D8|nr:uncharacterized protein LOC127251379 [Andrographis paniculata]
MANAWRRTHPTKILTPKTLLLFVSTSFLLLFFFYLSTQNPNSPKIPQTKFRRPSISTRPINPFNCRNAPQAHPVFANTVEGLNFPFMYSLSDFGNLPEKPHKNIVRTLKGKAFRRPDISATVQELLGKMRSENRSGVFVDIGANVGMASFAAAVMGFKVLAFEPVFENLQRICDGIYFNRVEEFVEVFEAAASDATGNITFHKLVGRLDNSAVSATGAKLAFKSNEEIALQVKSIPLDEVIGESEPVLMIKIDVQGWEHHVLKGASKLLSREKSEAPYLIYEEDERLLAASNSSSQEIRSFLRGLGYKQCVQHGTDAHCTKTD